MYNLIIALFLLILCSSGICAESKPAPAVSVLEAQIEQVLDDYVKRKNDATGWQTRIKRLEFQQKYNLPHESYEFEVVAPQQWEGWGAVNLSVLIRKGTRLLKSMPVRMEVEAITDIVVAGRQIQPGELISKNDLIVQRKDIAAVGGKFVSSIKEVDGWRARTSIRANSPLRKDQLERIPIVKSGQLVTIVAENESIHITVSGKAKGSGSLGDIIMVQNLSAQKDIPAKIIAPDLVQVLF